MSSKVGVIQRSLWNFRATTTPWRQAPSCTHAPQLGSPRYYCGNALIPKNREGQPRFLLTKQLVDHSTQCHARTQSRSRKSFSSAANGGDQAPSQSGTEIPISALESDRASSSSGGIPLFGGEPIQFGPTALKLKLGETEKTVEYAHLRDSCACPKCVDSSTKQRNIQTSHIPLDIQPRSYGVKDGNLVLQWHNDMPGFDHQHTSVYSQQEVTALCPTPSPGGTPDKHRILWDRELFEQNDRRIDYNDYMNNEEAFARGMRDLSRYGLVILANVPDSREMVEKVATRMGPLRNSFYGETWDVRSVQQPKNVAYTDQFLNFHMDLLYMRDPPGYQLLHCLRNSCTGGESLFSDAFRAAKYLFHEDRAKFDALVSFEVNYGYKNMNQNYQKTWPTFELLPESEQKPGKMGIDHINYSPPFQARFHQTSDPEWNAKYREYIDAVGTFGRLLEDPSYMYEFKLTPGDCAIFENRRVVHARRAFDTTSGERWLAGTYVDEDAVRSKFRVLLEKYPEIWSESPLAAPKKDDIYQELPPWLSKLA